MAGKPDKVNSQRSLCLIIEACAKIAFAVLVSFVLQLAQNAERSNIAFHVTGKVYLS